MDMPIEKIERYKRVLVDFITDNKPINALEANGIRKALGELCDYKRLASVEEVYMMIDNKEL